MIDEEINYDIKVVNAFKNYGNNCVLDGLNMSVQSCTIYGLLGPSGCGKSTLLQCILGTLALDYGCIDLKANSLKDLGYMPQNLCLEENLTVIETLNYYGALYNMKQSDINIRINAMNTFLQLPNLNSFINEISGGQSRRVSLAVSLLHDPKIIILDEPTVGIDSLVRQKIWTEFKRMVELYNITIIITTHYIEEANQADCVGLMRNGQLIEEGPPHDLIIKYGTDTLEATFLTLCSSPKSNKVVHNVRREKSQQNQIIKKGKKFELYKIKALLKKNYYVGTRDYLLFIAMVILPILQSLIFCFYVGVNFHDMPIIVNNEEVDIVKCQYFNMSGCIFDENYNLTMSCVVLNYLTSQKYKLVEVENQKTGEILLSKSNYFAFLHFPKNYTNELIKYIDDRENYNRKSRIYVSLTNENYVYRTQIADDIFRSVRYLIRETLKACSNNPKSIGYPLEINTTYGTYVKSYQNSFVTLFVSIMGFLFSSLYGVSSMMSEKKDGIFCRSSIAGASLLELLTSMFILNTVIYIFQSFCTCFIVYVVFMNPILITKSLLVYLLAMLLLNWMSFFIGVLVAVWSPSLEGCTYVITGMAMSQLYLSGTMWPVEGQHYYLQKISELLPIRLIGRIMTNVALKGWSLNNTSMLLGMSTAFAYIVILILSLVILGKFKKDLWFIQK